MGNLLGDLMGDLVDVVDVDVTCCVYIAAITMINRVIIVVYLLLYILF